MISSINSVAARAAYSNNSSGVKQTQKVDSQKAEASISSQGDMSKIDQIKNSIESGEYKINLAALSQKIADELL